MNSRQRSRAPAHRTWRTSGRQVGAILVVLSVIAGGPLLHGGNPVTAAQETRPNILFLMVDDMRRDELRFMPRTVSWIANGGVKFRNAIMPNPLCCPSRASVLTGRHAHNHKVWSHNEPYGFHVFDDRSTLPVWLRRVGYKTTYLGKYLNGYGEQPPPRRSTGRSVQYVPPGWSSWRGSIDGGLPSGHPYHGSTYNYFDTTLNRNGNGYISNEGRYQSVVYGDMTATSIKRLAAQSAPFFSYVSFTAPHNGGPIERDDPGLVYNTWSHRYAPMGTPARPGRVHGKFDRVLTQAPGRAWFSETPTNLHGGYSSVPPITDQEWRHIKEAARQRAEAVSVVDESVGRIMRALQESGELDRTLVVFTSDNGYFLGERRIRHGKSWPYSPSGRVPLLMRGPGIPAGEVRDDPYLSVDHAATLAAAARVDTPYVTDGVSMLSVARRGDQGWRRPVLTESTPRHGETLPSVQGIRTPTHFYTRWASGQEELFLVTRDAAERHNVADETEYSAVLALMRRALMDVRNCAGVSCSPPLSPAAADASP
jgi:N-acetylglucosamine-6-sulfatase